MSPRLLLVLSPFVIAVMLGKASSPPDEPALEETGPIDDFSIEHYRGVRHPVLVFAASPADPKYQHAIRIFMRNTPYLEQRDLIVVEALERGVSRAGGREIPAEAVATLRERFGCEEGAFAVVLVGKDVTEKARWAEFEGLGELLAAVEALPMHQQEPRERQPGSGG